MSEANLAGIGTLSKSQTNFVLPQASLDLFVAAFHGNEVMNYFKTKQIMNYERSLETIQGAGVTVNMRNRFRVTGKPNKGDGNPYRNDNKYIAKYGNRSINIAKIWRSFEFPRDKAFTQQSTSINLQQGHTEDFTRYMTDIILKGVLCQLGSNNGTIIKSPDILDDETLIGDDRQLLTLNNPVAAPSTEYHLIEGGKANPQSLSPSDTLRIETIMEAVTRIGRTYPNLERWNIMSGATLGCMFLSHSDLYSLMKQSVAIGSGYVFGDVYQSMMQGGKIKEIGGLISTFNIPGIPLDFVVLPDSYFHEATHSGTSVPQGKTRRLFIAGKHALDFATGRMTIGKQASSVFRVSVDPKHEAMAPTITGLAEGVFGGKKTQIPHRKTGVMTDIATFTIDVHTGEA